MRVNEIFKSLQGEGFNTGTTAVFIRLSGCNLRCPFCDTQHHDGIEMSEQEIIDHVLQYEIPLVVITGGEPSLQLTSTLVTALHKISKTVAVETNGTHPLPENVDWITLSPKDMFVGDEARIVLTKVNEIKVIFDGEHEPKPYNDITVTHGHFLQPCDTGDNEQNDRIVRQTVDYIMRHPQWRLSLQTHKMIQIP